MYLMWLAIDTYMFAESHQIEFQSTACVLNHFIFGSNRDIAIQQFAGNRITDVSLSDNPK